MAKNSPVDTDIRHIGSTWIRSALIAAGLNLGLFLLMPALIDSQPAKPAFENVVSRINLVRLKKPEREKPPQPVKKPEIQPKEQPAPTASHPPSPKLTLPFAINPRLPSGPTTLDLPPPDTSLKGSVGTLFSVGDLDAPMTVLVRIPPAYPLRARQRGIEGWVRVQFVVDEQGKISGVKVMEAQPEGIFEQSVRQCVVNWRFKPGTIQGLPVKALVETTVKFELE